MRSTTLTRDDGTTVEIEPVGAVRFQVRGVGSVELTPDEALTR